MGAVPNAVFERLLEAVAQGQSATLMEQLNMLVNAGHSPSSLARQMVRYLRNTLMAKLAGEQTELLQISADERARAARTAMLFSEEEITRNLQIVLRTFDDLNYRQEQRFHLELGLLKLIHAQRLLPIEELLSGVAGGMWLGAPRAAASHAAPAARPVPAPGRRQQACAESACPALGISVCSLRQLEPGPSIKQSAAPCRLWPSGRRCIAAVTASHPRPRGERAEPAIVRKPSTSALGSRAILLRAFPAAAVPATGYAEAAPMTDGALARAPRARACRFA